MPPGNGHPLSRIVQQVNPIADPCRNCGEPALVGSGQLQLQRRSYIHVAPGQAQAGKFVKVYVMCFHCGLRDTLSWNEAGHVSRTNICPGDVQEPLRS